MKYLRFLPFVGIGVLMILHGIAHSPAILGSWKLVTIDDVSRQPNVWLTGAGDGLLFVLGAFWLLAALSYVVAGVGVLRQAPWWPLATGIAIVASLPMTMLWRDDAAVGLVLNVIILGILVVWMAIVTFREQRLA